MEAFIPVIILIALVIYFVECIMNPEKHKVALIVFAILGAFFGAVADASKKSNRRR